MSTAPTRRVRFEPVRTATIPVVERAAREAVEHVRTQPKGAAQ